MAPHGSAASCTQNESHVLVQHQLSWAQAQAVTSSSFEPGSTEISQGWLSPATGPTQSSGQVSWVSSPLHCPSPHSGLALDERDSRHFQIA